MAQDLLLEIGVEELPASFVAGAVAALPQLVTKRLAELRLTHGAVRATGTPRRLALFVDTIADAQPDLDEEVLGPPARIAFDAAGAPTKAALVFAQKLGLAPEQLVRVSSPKGDYVAGRKQEKGRAAAELLPVALEALIGEIPFRKSMRWGDGEVAFGRPIRWLLGLLGERPLEFAYAGVRSGVTTQGHRFLAPAPFTVASPSAYEPALRAAHVVVSSEERERVMVERLHSTARELGGSLIEDEFLVGENGTLVEEPQIVAGTFEERFLALPERVILEVAKGHQRYFGVRGPDGKLLPRYLAVVNTAVVPANVARGNDRVMRARLADAKFFFDEDRAKPLAGRRAALDGIVFHKRLGTVGDKVKRLVRLVGELATLLGVDAETARIATEGAALAKCDLVTLMVGEMPELQGDMGRVYALAQGVEAPIAAVIDEHYQPRGADDAVAPSAAGALVALADRLDSLTGCFAIGLVPTGSADPMALRRAAIGVLRTLLDKRWELALPAAVRVAYAGFDGVKLDASSDETVEKLSAFLVQRLRGVLEPLPGDVIDACIAAGSDVPQDVALRARALDAIAPDTRVLCGEVLKRAANIAKDAKDGEPVPPATLAAEVPPSEQMLFDSLSALRGELAVAERARDYARSLAAIGAFAPKLDQFFKDVFVMTDDLPVRENRLRLMRDIQSTCSRLARFNLLSK